MEAAAKQPYDVRVVHAKVVLHLGPWARAHGPSPWARPMGPGPRFTKTNIFIKIGNIPKEVAEFDEEFAEFAPGIRRARALGPGPLGPGPWARAHGPRPKVHKNTYFH